MSVIFPIFWKLLILFIYLLKQICQTDFNIFLNNKAKKKKEKKFFVNFYTYYKTLAITFLKILWRFELIL